MSCRDFDCMSGDTANKNFSTSERINPDEALSNASCLLAGVMDYFVSGVRDNNMEFIANHALASAKAIVDSMEIKELN